MSAAESIMPEVGTVCALNAVGLSVATYYRGRKRRRCPENNSAPRKPHHRRLNDVERQHIADVLHDERFVDCAPAQVVATLLDEQQYLCSERTMYRVLAERKELRERRNQLRHPAYAKPELMATGPNQVWSWDITKLRTMTKWTYLYLYVIIDIYSRYVVGWMLAEHENAAHAKRLIEETYDRHGVAPGQVILHSDRGPAMRSKTVAQLLGELDVTSSFSRPYVSDDNPFSESQFKTLKYHPSFPTRFGGMDDGLSYLRGFFPWYNDVHHHSALAYATPADAHFGRANDVLAARHAVMLVAFNEHPERFVAGPPRQRVLPVAVWINPPTSSATLSTLGQSKKPQGARGTASPAEGETVVRAQSDTSTATTAKGCAADAPRHHHDARVAPQQSPILRDDDGVRDSLQLLSQGGTHAGAIDSREVLH